MSLLPVPQSSSVCYISCTYFSSAWKVISLMAGVFLLLPTSLRTCYTIHPIATEFRTTSSNIQREIPLGATSYVLGTLVQFFLVYFYFTISIVKWGSFAVGDGPSYEFNKRLFLLKWGSLLVNQKNKSNAVLFMVGVFDFYNI